MSQTVEGVCQVKSYAMTINLKDDADVIAKYKEYHRNTWPAVLEGLRRIGVSNMKIFLHGRRMVMYLEAADDFDLERDFPRYMESPRAPGVGRTDARLPGAGPGSCSWRVVGADGRGLRPQLVGVE